MASNIATSTYRKSWRRSPHEEGLYKKFLSSQPPFRLEDLPVERAIDIINLTVSSQSDYRSLMLVSRRFRKLVRFDCLPNVPIIITTRKQVLSFLNLIKTEPHIAPLIRYMWIIADICYLEESEFIMPIITSCINITHLACRAATLLNYASLPWLMKCKELTLVEGELHSRHFRFARWHPSGSRFLSQLTHLRVTSGPIKDQEWLKDSGTPPFTSLTHFALACDEFTPGIELTLKDTKWFPNLRHIVVTAHKSFPITSDAVISDVVQRDSRVSFVPHAEMVRSIGHYWPREKAKARREVAIWKDSLQGEFNLWEKGEMERKRWSQRSTAVETTVEKVFPLN